MIQISMIPQEYVEKYNLKENLTKGKYPRRQLRGCMDYHKQDEHHTIP